MPRTLGQLTAEERGRIVAAIHQEAEEANWSGLNNQQKGQLYRKWEHDYDLSHAAIKDGVMKGFDVRQRVPKRGEARIQQEVRNLLEQNGIFVHPSLPVWTGRERADFLIGFHQNFATHVVEVERADSWAEGLRQVLWYRAAYFQQQARQIQAMLILFGDVSKERFAQIKATCDDNHIMLCTYKLRVGGRIETVSSLETYLKQNNALSS